MKNTYISILIIVVVVIGVIFLVIKDNREKNNNPIQSHRSYDIKLLSDVSSLKPNTPTFYSFSIADEQGGTLKDFAITHTKPMHVIVVRKDLTYFQHVHPEYDQMTGAFTLKDLTFPADGQYRIFADFAANGGQKGSVGMPLGVTISEDVTVGMLASYKPQSIGTEEKTKIFDGMQVSLTTQDILTSGAENMLMFNLSQNGKPVTKLEPYLGALGHSVIFREDTLDFIHAHPMGDINDKQTGAVSFMVDFPESGKYKVFTQFQINGKITTTDFVVSVSKGNDVPNTTPSMDHNMH